MASRMEGTIWAGGKGACACTTEPTKVMQGPRMMYGTTNPISHGTGTPVYIPDDFTSRASALIPYTCDAETSCAYTQTRPGTHGFVVEDDTTVLYITGDKVECRSYTGEERAQHWCIAYGNACIGLVRRGAQYCIITPEHTTHTSEAAALQGTWHDTGCKSKETSGMAPAAMYQFCNEARSDPTKAVECCGEEGCVLSCELQEETSATYTKYAKRYSTDVEYEWVYTAGDLPAGYDKMDHYKPFEAMGVIAACASNTNCTAVGWDTSGGSYTYKGSSTIPKSSTIPTYGRIVAGEMASVCGGVISTIAVCEAAAVQLGLSDTSADHLNNFDGPNYVRGCSISSAGNVHFNDHASAKTTCGHAGSDCICAMPSPYYHAIKGAPKTTQARHASMVPVYWTPVAGAPAAARISMPGNYAIAAPVPIENTTAKRASKTSPSGSMTCASA